MATQFYIRRVLDNSRSPIGWAVISRSKVGGERTHCTQMGQDKAKAACEAEAARLEAEAEANRLRAKA